MGRNGNGKKPRWGTLDPKLLDPSGGQVDQPAVLPGYEGVPFRGPIPNVKESDPFYRQPQIGSKVHIEILDLSNDEHLERYSKVSQMVANGFAKMSQERIEYDPDKKNWRVFVRWLEMYAYDPTKGNNYGRNR
jgi:hypothetical protein